MWNAEISRWGGDNRCASFGEERRGSYISARCNKKAAPHVRSSPVCGEKKQSADEPGFVLCGAKCSSFIWMRRCRHILSFYPPTFLRRESNEPPSNVGLHELSASEVHGLPRHHATGGLLPHLLTLTGVRCETLRRRLFSSARVRLHRRLPIKKRNALCCPDFPHASHECGRRTVRLFLFCLQK